jgi:cytochrome c oxidase cbb3-type subunit 3
MTAAGRVLVVAGCLLVTSCEREARRFTVSAGWSTVASGLEHSEVPPADYEENAYAVAQGKALYNAFNCVGCHANGGGGIGPALMDAQWIYGFDLRSIYTSIAEGRPNGMPAFGSLLTGDQIWQLAAYVRAMSGGLRKDVEPGRSDNMSVRPAEQSTSTGAPQSAMPMTPGQSQ